MNIPENDRTWKMITVSISAIIAGNTTESARFARLPPPFEYFHGPASLAHPSEEIGSVRQLRGRKGQSVVAELGRAQNAQLAHVLPSPGLPAEYWDLPALPPVPVPQSRGPFPGRGR